MNDIDDINDHRIKLFHSLKTNSNHNEQNLFVADSEKVVVKLIESNLTIETIFATKEFYEKHYEIIRKFNISQEKILTSSKELLNQIVGYKLHQGVMAIGRIPNYSRIDELDNSVIIMNNIVDSGNVGAIIRNAVAFGIKSLIFDNSTSHSYLRKAVRVSMGNIFDMKIFKSGNLMSTIEELKNKQFQIIAAEINSNSKPIHTVHPKKPIAIIFGNESKGIDSKVLDLCNEIIHIPISDSTKSINVATSSAIMFFYLNNINIFK